MQMNPEHETLQKTVCYPLELMRTRLAVCPMGTYRGIWDCWGQIVRKEGWACFYRGLTPSLVSLWFRGIRVERALIPAWATDVQGSCCSMR